MAYFENMQSAGGNGSGGWGGGTNPGGGSTPPDDTQARLAEIMKRREMEEKIKKFKANQYNNDPRRLPPQQAPDQNPIGGIRPPDNQSLGQPPQQGGGQWGPASGLPGKGYLQPMDAQGSGGQWGPVSQPPGGGAMIGPRGNPTTRSQVAPGTQPMLGPPIQQGGGSQLSPNNSVYRKRKTVNPYDPNSWS